MELFWSNKIEDQYKVEILTLNVALLAQMKYYISRWFLFVVSDVSFQFRRRGQHDRCATISNPTEHLMSNHVFNKSSDRPLK